MQNNNLIYESDNSDGDLFNEDEEIHSDFLEKICPNFENKTFYGITGTNGKTTTGFYLNQLIFSKSLFIGTTEADVFKKITT